MELPHRIQRVNTIRQLVRRYGRCNCLRVRGSARRESVTVCVVWRASCVVAIQFISKLRTAVSLLEETMTTLTPLAAEVWRVGECLPALSHTKTQACAVGWPSASLCARECRQEDTTGDISEPGDAPPPRCTLLVKVEKEQLCRRGGGRARADMSGMTALVCGVCCLVSAGTGDGREPQQVHRPPL